MSNNKFQYKFLMTRDEAKKHWQQIRKDIGAQLFEFRRNQKLNIEEVSDALSLSVTTLDDFESGEGKISIDRLLYVCRFYGAAPQISLRKIEGLDYDRAAERETARLLRQNRTQEEDDVK